MRFGHLVSMCTLAMAAAAAVPASSFAQSYPEFVQLSRASAATYRPDSGPAPHIAFLVAHRTANNMNTSACTELSKRGFMVVCFNTRFINNETIVNWEQTPLDVKSAIDYARAQPGITKVVLLGHSGGSPLMSLYQAIAENGVEFCQKPERMVKCPNNVGGLKPADGLVFPDAHPGNPAQALRGINPSLSIVNGKVLVDPSLDPFDPKNGYNPEGPSSPSTDKDYIVIEGAVHGYTPCRACEETPGQYSNTVKNLFDYIANWANKRFA